MYVTVKNLRLIALRGYKKTTAPASMVYWRSGLRPGTMIWRSGFDSSPTPDFSKSIENHSDLTKLSDSG